MKVTSALSALPPLMEFIGGVAFCGRSGTAARRLRAGRLTTGEFVAFMTALFMMYAPAKKLSRVNADLQQAMAAAERIFDDARHAHRGARAPGRARRCRRSAARIEFRDVQLRLRRRRRRRRCDGVSFAVGAGQTLAIVGRSGAGKTTLVNLMPRFYDVTGGRILIDGHDMRDVTLASLRAQIGIVTQETVLFDDTIAANIAYGRPAATTAEIEAAARAAHAHEFIARSTAATRR